MSIGIRKRNDKTSKPKTNANDKPDSPPKPCPVIGAFFFHRLHKGIKPSVHNTRHLIAHRFVQRRHVVQQIGVRYRIMPRRRIRLLLLLAFLLLPLHRYACIISFFVASLSYILPHLSTNVSPLPQPLARRPQLPPSPV